MVRAVSVIERFWASVALAPPVLVSAIVSASPVRWQSWRWLTASGGPWRIFQPLRPLVVCGELCGGAREEWAGLFTAEGCRCISFIPAGAPAAPDTAGAGEILYEMYFLKYITLARDFRALRKRKLITRQTQRQAGQLQSMRTFACLRLGMRILRQLRRGNSKATRLLRTRGFSAVGREPTDQIQFRAFEGRGARCFGGPLVFWGVRLCWQKGSGSAGSGGRPNCGRFG